MKARFVILAVSALAASQALAADRFKPEQLVTSVKGKLLVACMQEADLRKLIAHANAGEKTKAGAMFSGPCFSVEPGQVYKVLSIRPDAMEVGLIAQKEPDGVWVLPGSFTAVAK